jgi:hypothetical protein
MDNEDLTREIQEKQMEYNRLVVEGTQSVLRSTQEALNKLPGEFERGLNRVQNMFVIQFVLGVVLLLSSIPFHILGYDVLTYIFGGAGGVTLITTFITTPPIRLQKNRVDLSQWMMAYFNWFNSLLATSGMVQLLAQGGSLTWETFRDVHTFLLDMTTKTLHLIDETCEFRVLPSREPKKD